MSGKIHLTDEELDAILAWHSAFSGEGYDDDFSVELREKLTALRVERQTWYFTFGWGQPHAQKFFVVENATYVEAREKMVAAFGRNWGFQYDSDAWFEDGVSQAERYNLTQIK